MTLRRSALPTAAVTLALAAALLTFVSSVAGTEPADAAPTTVPDRTSSARAVEWSGVTPWVAQQQPDPDEPESDTSQPDEPASHDIVVRPDTEVRPQQAEDRGGALQITVLLIVVAGIGTIAALAVRESRRRRDRSATGA